MPPLSHPGTRVLVPIVEQHAEEASFLWLLRDAAVDAPLYAIRHLARLEERIEAHIDGLRVAGETGIEIAMAQLDRHREAGELFAAAILALESGEPHRLEPLLEVARAAPAAERGLLGAIGWVGKDHLRPRVQPWLDSSDPFERRLGLVACSLHRADPRTRLGSLMADPDPLVRSRAYRLAGELGRVELGEQVARAAAFDEHPGGAFWAAWAAGLLGYPDAATSVLLAAAERQNAHSVHAIAVAARVLPPARAASWLRALNHDAGQLGLVVRALGQIGDPTVVPWLIGQMNEPAIARLAGESFALITAVDLAFEDLEGSASDSEERSSTENPADERVAIDSDDHLPWPDPQLVAAWWGDHRHRFQNGTRYLLGRPAGEEAGRHAFVAGYQRQRRAAAYELALVRRDAILPNWRARTNVR